MRYITVAISTFLLTAFFLTIRFKTGWIEGFWPPFWELAVWAVLALALKKTTAWRIPARRPVHFRELVIIISMVFATLVANVSIQLVQRKVFGRTYVSSYEDPVPRSGSTEKPVVPSVPEKIATNLVAVAGEEISSRWIILGALLMVMPAGWAIAFSSLLFALMHTIMPAVSGMSEVGLFRLGPTGAIGVFCGIAFVRYGLAAAIAIHFFVNMMGWFAYNQTYIAKTVLFGSAFVTLIILPLTLWFTRTKRQRGRFTDPATV